jgi:cysteine-rich repeat protein
MGGCLTCTSYSNCTLCASAHFFLNTIDAHCHYCNSTQFQCKKCYFNTTTLAMRCTKCQTGFHLDSNYKCVCVSGKPIDGFCMDVVGCISAIAGPICTGCDVGMVLSHGSCVCPDDYWFVTNLCTNIVGCVVVKRTLSVNTCLFCDLTIHFELGVDGLCHCKTYYEKVDESCSEICGDGVLLSLPCDDGNTVSGDGCSSKCAL